MMYQTTYKLYRYPKSIYNVKNIFAKVAIKQDISFQFLKFNQKMPQVFYCLAMYKLLLVLHTTDGRYHGARKLVYAASPQQHSSCSCCIFTLFNQIESFRERFNTHSCNLLIIILLWWADKTGNKTWKNKVCPI